MRTERRKIIFEFKLDKYIDFNTWLGKMPDGVIACHIDVSANDKKEMERLKIRHDEFEIHQIQN